MIPLPFYEMHYRHYQQQQQKSALHCSSFLSHVIAFTVEHLGIWIPNEQIRPLGLCHRACFFTGSMIMSMAMGRTAMGNHVHSTEPEHAAGYQQ